MILYEDEFRYTSPTIGGEVDVLASALRRIGMWPRVEEVLGRELARGLFSVRMIRGGSLFEETVCAAHRFKQLHAARIWMSWEIKI